MMAKERLLFHCSLAKVYPQLPEPPAAAPEPSLLDKIRRALIAPAEPEPAVLAAWQGDARFVSLDDARGEIRGKLAGLARDTQRIPEHDEVYRPLVDVLERRLGELELRGKNDLTMAAQLRIFPDQFEIILHKLATTQADVGEVVSDVKLLLEQTDDTVRFAEDTRSAERHTLVQN
jgi:hypothetical protein